MTVGSIGAWPLPCSCSWACAVVARVARGERPLPPRGVDGGGSAAAAVAPPCACACGIRT